MSSEATELTNAPGSDAGRGTPLAFTAPMVPDAPVDKPDLPRADRDKKGRFKKGNTANVINKRGGYNVTKQALLRSVILEAATPERMQAMALAMIAKACLGDVHAARLICEYTLGKPQAGDTQERIARLEAAMDLSDDLDPEVIAARGIETKKTKLIESLYESIDAKGAELNSEIDKLEANAQDAGESGGEGN